MRFSVIFAFSALAAVSIQPSNAASYQECLAFHQSLENDAKILKCFPSQSINHQDKEKFLKAETLVNTQLNQYCTTAPCSQDYIDAKAKEWADACAQDYTVYAKLYTPLRKAVCYLDFDKEFVMTKILLAPEFMSELNKFNKEFDVTTFITKAMCTKGYQHFWGTIIESINSIPELSPLKSYASGGELLFSQLCGDEFANDLKSATGPPYPEIQKSLVVDNDATRASSFSALPVLLSVVALATQF